MALPQIKVVFDDSKFVVPAPEAMKPVVAFIYNDARGINGFPYFWSVEKGRVGFSAPTPAGFKSLRWVGRPGTIAAFSKERYANSVFAKSVRPTRPQRIRQAAYNDSVGSIASMEYRYDGTRAGLVSIVNRAANIMALALARNTPRRTGALSISYRIVQAE